MVTGPIRGGRDPGLDGPSGESDHSGKIWVPPSPSAGPRQDRLPPVIALRDSFSLQAGMCLSEGACSPCSRPSLLGHSPGAEASDRHFQRHLLDQLGSGQVLVPADTHPRPFPSRRLEWWCAVPPAGLCQGLQPIPLSLQRDTKVNDPTGMAHSPLPKPGQEMALPHSPPGECSQGHPLGWTPPGAATAAFPSSDLTPRVRTEQHT